MQFRFGNIACVATMIVLMLPMTGLAQAGRGDDPTIRAVARPDGIVYVYHTNVLPLGYGFRLFRGGVELTTTPVYSVQSGAELQEAMGPEYQRLAGPMGEEAPTGVLLRLQSDRVLDGLATFLFPEVARARGKLFIDSTATLGSVAVYSFEFVTPDGRQSGEKLEAAIPLNAKPIAQPNALRASNVETRVDLVWHYPFPTTSDGRSDDVIRFHVYREEGGRATRLDDGPILRNAAVDTFSISFQAKSVGQTERYFVRAVDVTGHEGPRSGVLEFLVRDNQPPAFIPAVEATATSLNTVVVQWAPSPSTDVVGYKVYRAERADEKAVYKLLTSEPLATEPLQFTDSGADGTGGKGYFYAVSALDGAGNESPMSNPAMALVYDREAPPAVANLVADYDPAENAVTLTWSMGELPRDFLTFVVLRRRLADGAAKANAQLNRTDLRTTTFVDRGPDGRGFAEDGVYRFTVLAADSTRNMSDSTFIEFTVPNLRPPAAPQSLTATNNGGRRVQLNWTGSDALDVIGYRVYRRGESSADSLLGEVGIEPNYSDEAVVAPLTYTYSVAAIDIAGNESERSEPVAFQMADYDPPRSVRNVRARRESDGAVIVSWEPVVVHDLAGYRVSRSDSQTGVFTVVREAAATERTWRDPSAGESAWYRVETVDTSGNVSKPGTAAPARQPDENLPGGANR